MILGELAQAVVDVLDLGGPPPGVVGRLPDGAQPPEELVSGVVGAARILPGQVPETARGLGKILLPVFGPGLLEAAFLGLSHHPPYDPEGEADEDGRNET